MSNVIDSTIEEIKKYPVLGLVPIAGALWLILRTYPGSIAIIPITTLSTTRNIVNNDQYHQQNR